MIRVKFDSATVSTGEFLTGRIHWRSDDERMASEILVAIEWQTDGEGNVARGSARLLRFIPPRGSREAEVPFRFMIPFEGPISFQTELITMSWFLRARIARSGFDETAEVPFRVEPRSRKRPASSVEVA